LNARWSEDQSATMDRKPAAGGAASIVRVGAAVSGMGGSYPSEPVQIA
jgi:hypothetical protein